MNIIFMADLAYYKNKEGQKRMEKKLNFLSIFFLGVNSIIGSGIFLLPSKVYEKVGVGSFMAIFIAGLLAFCLALCFAECASKFTKDGSAFIYCKNAFGDFMGFEIGVFSWFISIISWSAETQGFLTILGSLYPRMAEPFFNKLLVVIICIFLGLLNYYGVKFSKILNNIITISKLVPLILFIVIGIFFIHWNNFSLFTEKTFSIFKEGDLGNATLIIFYAFTGFDLLAIAAEDMNNPEKNLPKAIIGVILFCCCFYFLIFLVSIGVAGKNLSLTNVPIAYVTSKIFGKIGFLIISLATLISIGGVTIALSFIGPRSGVAMSECGYLPKFLSKMTKYETPGNSIFITTLLVIILGCYGNFIYLASLTVIARFIEYIPTALAVLVLRKKDNLKTSYKIPLGPIIPIFSIVLSLIVFFQSDFEKILLGFLGIIFNGILYFFIKKINKK
ncbi:MAG: APC family permease [Cetobacterium sp.]|uniref:APC family permease n=1 Tax=Cetobacterium sp. TaxID=2071632 RepID=UPI003F380A1A